VISVVTRHVGFGKEEEVGVEHTYTDKMCSWDKIEEWNFDSLSACQYRNGVRSPIKV